ncbi:diguanylate cyclase [Dactylosporangium aurantiacum]|uniref:Diguanylate cyclase n=1 Tax=Dactylosporangium aurantiacum TaxID=35754 RepID=A0A9Q9IJH2_9ACTN|nr:diguanylate cyclase [Dactylosporangium aurantiacum]MDG6104254.1 diguanylate cyclase [Dactylosporangium aurantiacum]UWZ56746.1 diguanylate cyclase [Dactylosporangium aurantiacum]
MTGRLLRDPVLLGLVAGSALVVGCLLTGAGGVRLFWSALPVFDLLIWVFTRRVAALPQLPAPARRFWRLSAHAAVFFVAGDLSQTAVAWLRPGPAAAMPNPFQAGAILAGACWLIWVMLTHPAPLATVRFWLDAGSVLVGAGVLIWLLLLPRAGGSPVALLLGTVIIGFAAFAAVKLVLSGNAPLSVPAAAPMVAAAAIQGLVGSLVAADGRHLHLLLAAQVLPPLLLAVGPRLQEHSVRLDPRRSAQRAPRPYSLLPYTTLVGLFAALPVVVHDGPGADVWVLLGGLAATTALVVARQLLAFRENALLLAELGAQQEHFRSLLAHSTDITSIVDTTGALTYVSPATQRLLGKSPAAVLGTTVVSHIHPEDLPAFAAAMDTLRATPNASVGYQVRYAHADGSWRWLDVVSRNLLHLPSVRGYVSNARDATQARLLQDELRHQATHDGLTGLANRALFDARLAAAAEHQVAAVLLVDLDDFKAINDTHGHHAGDAVLVGVAERLAASVPAGGTAARIGGDEFAVLLPGCDVRDADAVARRFLDLLDVPVPVDGHRLPVRASVGVVDGDPRAAEALLQRADARMYAVKREAQMSSSS